MRPPPGSRIVSLITRVQPTDTQAAKPPAQGGGFQNLAVLWRILVVGTAVAMLALTAIPAAVWHRASASTSYHGFDRHLLSINEQNYQAPNQGVLLVSADSVEIRTVPDSIPSVHLLTTAVRSFKASLKVRVDQDSPGTTPLRLGLWNPRSGSGFFLVFGPAPDDLISTESVVAGIPSQTLVGGTVESVPISHYTPGQTYDFVATVDKDSGFMGLDLSGSGLQPAVHATANPSRPAGLATELKLTLTAAATSTSGTSSATLQDFNVSIPTSSGGAVRIDDPRASIALIVLAALGVVLLGIGLLIWIAQRREALRIAAPKVDGVKSLLRSHRRPLTTAAIGLGAVAVVNALLFGLGTAPFDMTDQETWSYIANAYGPVQVLVLAPIVPVAKAWNGVPYAEAVFPYQPVMVYLFAVFGWISRVVAAVPIDWVIKATSVLFGLLDGLLVVGILRRIGTDWRKSAVAGALFVFNPAVWFSMSIWGANHVISVFFVLLAILLVEYDHPVGAWLTLGIGALTRPQMLIFGLIVGVVLLRRFGLARSVYAIAWAVVVVFLLLLPFTTQTSPSLPVDLLANTVQVQTLGGNERSLTTVSLDAYTFWPMVTLFQAGQTSLYRILYPSDSSLFGSFTYQQAGLVLTALILFGSVWTLVARRREAILNGGYLPVVAFAGAGFLMFTTGLAATHFILALPFILMTRKWLHSGAYLTAIIGWSATTLVAMYGILAVDLANSDWLHEPLFGQAQTLSSLSAVLARFYTSDRVITFGCAVNLAVLGALLVASVRSHLAREVTADAAPSFWSISARAVASGIRSRVRVGDVRSPWLLDGLVGLSALTFAGVVYLNSYKNFFYDEWDFVAAYRPGQSTSILLPHNEHWSTIPILLWKLLFFVFGLRSHVPYEALAVAGHIACVILLFVLIRRRSGDIAAFAAALILLVLGTGATNIVFAFQLTWTLSIAFGLLAMLLLETGPDRWSRRRLAVVSALLLFALMSSGIGLGFLVAVTVQLLVARRRDILPVVAVPIVAYAAWFITYGAGLPGTPGAVCSSCPGAIGTDIHSIGPGYLANVVAYMALGLAAAAAGLFGLAVFGLSSAVGLAILVALVGLLLWNWSVAGRIEPWEVGLSIGLLAQFGLIALTRVRFGLSGASDPHYVYVGVVYLLPLLANAAKRLPWSSDWRPAYAGGLALIVLSNATQLTEVSMAQRDLMRTENAELRVTELFRGAPDMSASSPLDQDIMPQLTAGKYFPAIDEMGSPVPSSTPNTIDKLPPRTVDQMMVTLFGGALKATNNSEGTTTLGQCHTVDSSSGSTMEVQVPAGQTFMLNASRNADATMSLGFVLPPSSQPVRQMHLAAQTPQLVHTPNTGKPVLWRLRISTALGGQVQICGVDRVRAYAGNGVLAAAAAGGALDPGWGVTPDANAYSGEAAVLPAGTHTETFTNDIFGTPAAVPQGNYDIWYHVRVADPAGSRAEMTLGLFDYTSFRWLGLSTFRPDEVGSQYAWIQVAANLSPTHDHRVVPIAQFSSHNSALSTDWFVDQAVLVPAGSAGPTDLPVNG